MPDDLPKEFRRDRKVVEDKMTDVSGQKAARNEQKRLASRYANEVKNPCLKESESSMKCMSDQGYDRDQCTLYFKNYRNCMDFWNHVRRDRRSKGITPNLPLPEDRESVRKEYMGQWRP